MRQVFTNVLFLIFFLSSIIVSSQSFNWVVPFQNSFETIVTDMVTDSNGNIFAVGIFDNTVDFDPGPGLAYLNDGNSDKGNIFCVKLNSSGDLVWVHQIGGDFNSSVIANEEENIQPRIAIDSADNIYITGIFNYNVDFDTNSSSSFFIPNSSSNSVAHFVGKYSNNGNLIWVEKIGSDDLLSSIFKNIEVDNLGNIIMSGHFTGIVDFDPGNAVYNLSTDFNNDDVFFLKLDTNGNFQWAHQIGNEPTNDRAVAMGIDDDYLYITGYYRDNVDFNPSESSINLLESDNGSEDAFIAKYSLDDGAYQWAFSIGNDNGSDVGYAIKPDGLGNVIAAGVFRGTFDFDFSTNSEFNMSSFYNRSIYLLKVNADGEFIWVKNFGAENLSGTFDRTERPSDIIINSMDDIFLSGYYLGQIDTNPDVNEEEVLISEGDNDIFTVRLDENGEFQWSFRTGGSDNDFLYRMALIGDDTIILSGSFNDTVNFNPMGSNSITSSNLDDAFILSLTSTTLHVSESQVVNTMIFPNPTTTSFKLLSDTKITKAKLYDVNGRLIKTLDVNLQAEFNIQDLTNGTYFFIGKTSEGKKLIAKVIKE